MLEVGGGFVTVAFSNGEEAGGGDPGGEGFGRRALGQDVPGDLFAQKLVEGLVVVERLDDPVPVLGGFAHRVVGAIACGVGVAGDIEPVPAPAFAISLGGEQALDDALEGAGCGVF